MGHQLINVSQFKDNDNFPDNFSIYKLTISEKFVKCKCSQFAIPEGEL